MIVKNPTRDRLLALQHHVIFRRHFQSTASPKKCALPAQKPTRHGHYRSDPARQSRIEHIISTDEDFIHIDKLSHTPNSLATTLNTSLAELLITASTACSNSK